MQEVVDCFADVVHTSLAWTQVLYYSIGGTKSLDIPGVVAKHQLSA